MSAVLIRGVPPVGGKTPKGSSRNPAVPALIDTSTSNGALNPPLEGTMFATPFASVMALVWLTCMMTGIAGLPGFKSPPPPEEDSPPGRSTVV